MDSWWKHSETWGEEIHCVIQFTVCVLWLPLVLSSLTHSSASSNCHGQRYSRQLCIKYTIHWYNSYKGPEILMQCTKIFQCTYCENSKNANDKHVYCIFLPLKKVTCCLYNIITIPLHYSDQNNLIVASDLILSLAWRIGLMHSYFHVKRNIITSCLSISCVSNTNNS